MKSEEEDKRGDKEEDGRKTIKARSEEEKRGDEKRSEEEETRS